MSEMVTNTAQRRHETLSLFLLPSPSLAPSLPLPRSPASPSSLLSLPLPLYLYLANLPSPLSISARPSSPHYHSHLRNLFPSASVSGTRPLSHSLLIPPSPPSLRQLRGGGQLDAAADHRRHPTQ